MKCAVVSGESLRPSGPSRVRTVRLHQLVLGWLFPLLMVLGYAADARAYAWMIRHGYAKCDTCHTDPSGGEALNQMGRVQSESLLSFDWGKPTPSDASKFMYGLGESDHFRGGGSVRGMSIYSLGQDGQDSKLSAFPMQMDLYGSADFSFVKVGGSLGLAKVKPEQTYVKAALLTSTEEGYALVSRSHWLGFDVADRWFLRLGRMNLPFGVRTSEHTLMARRNTHTDRESHQQHGVAIAYSGGRWRGEGMVVLGNYQVAPDSYRERGFSGTLEYLLGDKLAVGVSSLILQSGRSLLELRQQRTLRHMHGATLRYAPLDELAVLAEFDVLKTTGRDLGFTGFLTGDYELMRGLHLAATGEWFDAGKTQALDVTAPGAGELNYALWGTAQWFFYTHWDVRADVVYNKGGAVSILGQIHTYF